jgi:hypothetical protein
MQKKNSVRGWKLGKANKESLGDGTQRADDSLHYDGLKRFCVFILLSRLSLGEEIGFRKQGSGFATKAIHTGQKPEQWNSR